MSSNNNFDPNISIHQYNAIQKAHSRNNNGSGRKIHPGVIAAIAGAVAVVALCVAVIFAVRGQKPAEISVWIPVCDGEDRAAAVEAVLEEFQEAHPRVTARLTKIPEDKYADAIAAAAKNNRLPTLFESTGLPDDILESAADLDKILQKKQAKKCLFLDQYHSYYLNTKRIPLGIVAPVALYLKNGTNGFSFKNTYFYAPEDFGSAANVAADPAYLDLIGMNFGGCNFSDTAAFLSGESNVYLTTTEGLYNTEIAQFQKDRCGYAFPNTTEIQCNFTYEWSIGAGTLPEIAAAEQLLSQMLDERYQSILMIKKAKDGILPVNETAFLDKLNQHGELNSMVATYDRFVFTVKYSVRYVLDGGAFPTAYNTVAANENQRELLTNPTAVSLDTASDGAFRVENPKKQDYNFIGWDITGMDETQHIYVLNDTLQSAETEETALHIGAKGGAAEANEFQDLRQSPGEVTFTAIWAPTVTIRYCTLFLKETSVIEPYILLPFEKNERGYVYNNVKKEYAERKLVAETTDPEKLRALLDTRVDPENGLHNMTTFGISRPGYEIAYQEIGVSWNKTAGNTKPGYLWTANLDWHGTGRQVRDFNENDNALQWISVLPDDRIENFCNGISVSVNVYVKWVTEPTE